MINVSGTMNPSSVLEDPERKQKSPPMNPTQTLDALKWAVQQLEMQQAASSQPMPPSGAVAPPSTDPTRYLSTPTPFPIDLGVKRIPRAPNTRGPPSQAGTGSAPHNPSRQRNIGNLNNKAFKDMNDADFSEQINGFRYLENNADLLSLQPGTYMVRYCRMIEGKQRFFGGGLLVKLDAPLNRYIVLSNCATKARWSVQTSNNRFFVKQTKLSMRAAE